jgi:hypothetical protein
VEPEPPWSSRPRRLYLWTLTQRDGWSCSLSHWVREWGDYAGPVQSVCAGAQLRAGAAAVRRGSLSRVNRLRAWLIRRTGAVFLGPSRLQPHVSPRAFKRLGGLSAPVRWLPSLPRRHPCSFGRGRGALVWTSFGISPRACEELPARPVRHHRSRRQPSSHAEVIRNAWSCQRAVRVPDGVGLWYLWGGGALPQG